MAIKNTKQIQKENIIKHGESLKKFFNLDSSTDALKLCKSLHRQEIKAHKITTALCNGDIEQEEGDKKLNLILDKVDKILNFRTKKILVFINGDARGYALKISDKHEKSIRTFGIYKDWGGYGIIAPEF